MPAQFTHTATAPPDGALRDPIRVLLVDDHPAVRAGARAVIDDQPDMRVVAEARNADEALRAHESCVDVAVVDYHLRHGQDGLWLTAALKRREPAPRVLIYSAFADGALAVLARVAGADGLLGKHELGAELCRAIRRLARGQHHLPAILSPVRDALRSRLDPRDQAIFGMLLHGIEPYVIADRLAIASDELHARRAVILRALKPARATSPSPRGIDAPLDYEPPRARSTPLTSRFARSHAWCREQFPNRSSV
jgi:DNA-binding NarL/FixJ family response regulator